MKDYLAHYCEICGYTLPEDAIEPCSCVNRQDSSFYTNESGWEDVWVRYGEVAYKVVRNGEMRVYYTDPSGNEHTIRYTGDLDELGISTDEQLEKMNTLGEELWSWVNNSWYEVWDASVEELEVEEYYSEPFYTLDEAVAYAIKLDEQYKERTK